MWWPICGEFFSENNNGADLFCKKLYDSSISGRVLTHNIVQGGTIKDILTPMDSFMIGRCSDADPSLEKCSGVCNLFKPGGTCKDKKCSSGEGKRITIQCVDQNTAILPETDASCDSKYPNFC